MKASVGTTGDSCDNALAESIIGLYKTEVIERQGWCGAGDVELSTLEWVDWFNQSRLLSSIGYTPPVEFGWCPKMYADKRRANKKQRRHGIFEVWKLKIPFAVPVAVGRI